jgi:hypothetical protein
MAPPAAKRPAPAAAPSGGLASSLGAVPGLPDPALTGGIASDLLAPVGDVLHGHLGNGPGMKKLHKDGGGVVSAIGSGVSFLEVLAKPGLWAGLGMSIAGAILVLLGVFQLSGVGPSTAARVVASSVV